MAAFSISNSCRRTALTSCGLVAIVCCAIDFARGEEATYLLKYKFQPEQFLYFEVENTMKIVTQFNGASETVTNTSQAWKQLRVVSVDETGNALLEPMIERVKLSTQTDGQDAITYDSLEDATPPLQFRDIKGTVGTVIARVNVSAHGELNQVIPVLQNNQALNDAAKKNDPQLNFLTVLPKTAVRIGESWKDRFTTDVTVEKSLKKDVIVQRTFTLVSVAGSIASIKLKTSVVTPINDPQMQVQLIQRTPTGVIEFDMAKGQIASMKTQIDETVFNAFGPKSSMSAVTKSVEKLLPSRPEFIKTASRTATKTN